MASPPEQGASATPGLNRCDVVSCPHLRLAPANRLGPSGPPSACPTSLAHTSTSIVRSLRSLTPVGRNQFGAAYGRAQPAVRLTHSESSHGGGGSRSAPSTPPPEQLKASCVGH